MLSCAQFHKDCDLSNESNKKYVHIFALVLTYSFSHESGKKKTMSKGKLETPEKEQTDRSKFTRCRKKLFTLTACVLLTLDKVNEKLLQY